MRLVVFIFSLFTSVQALAAIYNTLPDEIDINAHYVFYSHGFIVEGENPRPAHPRWGVYDYPEVLKSLDEMTQAVIISEHRAANTDPFEHANKLKGQVTKLLKAGVSAQHITLMGFSRGGFITAIASSYLANQDLNYVILAGCADGLLNRDDIALHGHILSIYETSDTVGSCADILKRSPNTVASFKEVAITTTKEHGAFYTPQAAWLNPIKDWLTQQNKTPAYPAYKVPRSQVITLNEPQTNRQYPVYIQLPKSYDSSSHQFYPVIYLTDAPYSFPVVTGATRFPMNSGKMQEAIIVALGYSKGSKGATSRVRDYTPVSASGWKMVTGNGKGHLDFFRQVVFPYVEANFRADADSRTFVGNSLGGLFGAYVLFQAPDTFANYVLGSPSVWFNDDFILSMPMQAIKAHTKVYVSVGSEESPKFGERENMVMGAKQLVDKISAENSAELVLRFNEINGASHATAFPTTAIQGLAWVLNNSNH